MRVISRFKDFYDCGIAYGIDPKIVFNRETTFEDSDLLPKDCLRNRYARRTSQRRYYTISQSFLFFCGKRYPFYVLDHTVEESWKEVPERKWTCAWSIQEADALFKKHHKVSLQGDDKFYWTWNENKIPADNEFDVVEDLSAVNEIYQSPIVIVSRADLNSVGRRPRDHSVIKNPNLKEMGFSRIMDPYTAFQEISMYLAGPLGEVKDTDLNPAASDVDKVRSHGLDDKYGFRNRPDSKS